VTGYTVSWWSGSSAARQLGTTASGRSVDLHDLAYGTTYTVEVRANSAAGPGATAGSHFMAKGKPWAAISSVSTGSGRVTVAFNVDAKGLTPVTCEVLVTSVADLQAGRDPIPRTRDTCVGVQTRTVTGLAAGEYHVAIRITNALGSNVSTGAAFKL
jgi:hypothetical protein